MTTRTVYKEIRDLVNENKRLKMNLSAAQDYIDKIKSRAKASLLAGLILGGLAGIFWRELGEWLISLL